MSTSEEITNAPDAGAVNVKMFAERTINMSSAVWQALAAVIDGMDDDEAGERLEALTPEELRMFHFQLDRIRTLTRNIRFRKMREAEEEAKEQHEAEVTKMEG